MIKARKCRSKEHLKVIPFCHTHTHTHTHTHVHTHIQALLKISLSPSASVQPVPQPPHFKINVPLFCCPLFFNPLARISKMANKDCHLLPQCFGIALKDASSISIDPIGLSSLYKFCFLANLYIPPWL